MDLFSPSCSSELWHTHQTVKYLKHSYLFPVLLSVYCIEPITQWRRPYSVLKVLADTLLAVDSGNLAMLTLLIYRQPSTVLTTTHFFSIGLLPTALEGVVINWFASYLSGHAQYVHTLVSISCRLWSSSG